jgi:hypothetical protein
MPRTIAPQTRILAVLIDFELLQSGQSLTIEQILWRISPSWLWLLAKQHRKRAGDESFLAYDERKRRIMAAGSEAATIDQLDSKRHPWKPASIKGALTQLARAKRISKEGTRYRHTFDARKNRRTEVNQVLARLAQELRLFAGV